MNPLERAEQLRQEADAIMRDIRLAEIVRAYGLLVPTGSYFLDVMVYPDLDVMISQVSIAQLFEIAGQLAEAEAVFQVVFEKARDPDPPGGLYLKPRIARGNWGRPWKVDIWSLDDATLDEKVAMMQAFKNRMTGDLREQIIRYKLSIMTPEHRTPVYSGYWIYKAFLDEGLREFAEVTRYLVDQGIQMR